jgi:hypothetical protein
LEIASLPVNGFKTDAANPGDHLDAFQPDLNCFSHVFIPIGLDGDLIQLWARRFTRVGRCLVEKELVCHGQMKARKTVVSHGVFSP